MKCLQSLAGNMLGAWRASSRHDVQLARIFKSVWRPNWPAIATCTRCSTTGSLPLKGGKRQTRQQLPSGVVEVPCIVHLPNPNFTVSGGSSLSRNIYDLLKIIDATAENNDNSNSKGGVALPGSNVTMWSKYVADLSTRLHEPERDILMRSLLNSLDKIEFMPSAELDVLLTHSRVVAAINDSDDKAFFRMVDKVWSSILENRDAAYLLMAARCVMCLPVIAPRSVYYSLQEPQFLELVKGLHADDDNHLLANLALLASMKKLQKAALNFDVIEAVCANLSHQFYRANLPTCPETSMFLLDLAQFVTNVQYYHGSMMVTYALYLFDMCKSERAEIMHPLRSAKAVAAISYALSHTSTPSVALLQELEGGLKSEDYASLRPTQLVRLVWSYIAQGIRPPATTLILLDNVVPKISAKDVRFNSEELDQVKHYLVASQPLIRQQLRDAAEVPKWLMDIKEVHREVELAVHMDIGLVSLCAVINPKRGGTFYFWDKAGMEPQDLIREKASSLPGYPVAVLAITSRSHYRPNGRVSGPCHRKALLLKSRGWRVLFVDANQQFPNTKSAAHALLLGMRKVCGLQ